MDTLVKFCLIGLVVGAWFSEYVMLPLWTATKHLLNAALSYLKVLGYLVELLHTKVVCKLAEAHPALLFTLLIGLCILLAQERAVRNAEFVAQNPHVVVTPWSVIP